MNAASAGASRAPTGRMWKASARAIAESAIRATDGAEGGARNQGAGVDDMLADARGELVRREPGCEQEALSHRHPQPHQELPLGFGFHAFGDEPEAEALGDAGHGLADRDIGTVAGHALQEQLAELEP